MIKKVESSKKYFYEKLINAVIKNSKSEINLLLKNGVDINITESPIILKSYISGSTAILVTVERNNYSMFKFLIEKEANLKFHYECSGYKNLLSIASILNRRKMVGYLLDQKVDIESTDILYKTALFHAVENKKLEICKLLVAGGADVNKVYKPYNSETVFFIACRLGFVDICIFLSSYVASINLANDKGETTLMYSVSHTKMINVTKMILNTYSECKYKFYNIDHKDMNGETALIWACRYNNLPAVKTLVNKYGADINLKNDKGNGCLTIAIENSNHEMVEFLLSKNISPIKGINYLLKAQEKGNTTICKLLYENGYHYHKEDKDIIRSINKSLRENHLCILEILLYKVNPNYIFKDGLSILMKVSHKGKINLCKILINRGADLDYQIITHGGKINCLNFISVGKYSDLFFFFLSYGVEILGMKRKQFIKHQYHTPWDNEKKNFTPEENKVRLKTLDKRLKKLKAIRGTLKHLCYLWFLKGGIKEMKEQICQLPLDLRKLY